MPVPADQKEHSPIVLPHSILAANNGGAISDAFLYDGPVLYKEAGNTDYDVPLFSQDWKYSTSNTIRSEIHNHLHSSHVLPGRPHRSQRVRTAIDYQTGSSRVENKTGQMFAYEMVHPYEHDKDGNEIDLVWQFEIRAPNEGAMSYLNELMIQTLRLGKTKTPAHISYIENKNDSQSCLLYTSPSPRDS